MTKSQDITEMEESAENIMRILVISFTDEKHKERVDDLLFRTNEVKHKILELGKSTQGH